MELIVVADPLELLDATFDTTLALMRTAQGRGHRVRHCEARHLSVVDGDPRAHIRGFGDDVESWADLRDVDAVLFRTDPPVDARYLHAVHVLDLLDRSRTLVVNDPIGIRVANEKLWCLRHADLCPPTLVTADPAAIQDFLAAHRRCVIKPIDGHAGRGVLRLDHDDDNRRSIVELATDRGQQCVVVQRWLDEVRHGNKRIFVHEGEAVAAVLRRPVCGDFRIGPPSALAELTPRDEEICARLAPELRSLGLFIVGLDVIGEHLIEVNVTSPGALHKADRLLGTELCHDVIDRLERAIAIPASPDAHPDRRTS